ncbi:MAG: sulfotransferase [Planctomycetota bacterium]
MGRPRRFHAYCVGTSKSGTTSLAKMLAKACRSDHEPTAVELIWQILGAADGSIGREQIEQYIVERDRRLNLEFESSQLLLYVLDILVGQFPNAKFILTIRDCYSWLRSVTNHELTRPINEAWRKMADVRFRKSEFAYSEKERILVERGLYTLDGYLSYWAEHNETVLRVVPRPRLLIVKTEEIDGSIARIADFLGIPPEAVDLSASRSNVAESKSNVLAELDPSLIEEKVQKYCRGVMGKFFPEVRDRGRYK